MEKVVLAIDRKIGSHKINQSGFSLIEILIVILVLVLILSMLTPALSRAKEQSRRLVCQSNLRQQGYLIKMYAASNNETYPVAPRYYPFGGLINWENYTCWIRTYQPASQMLLYTQGYTMDPSLFYCPSARIRNSNYINQKDHWDAPAQKYPRPNRFFLRCYYTNVTYATWSGFGYDTHGEPIKPGFDLKPEDILFLRDRAAQNSTSRSDTVLLSDIIQEATGLDAPSLNNHSWRGISRGGNIQYNDGSVRWLHIDETEVLLEMRSIKSCFRL